MSTPELAPRFTVTKLEAARRQLRLAISLWFQDADEVAVHTLACAAHQIIHDINQKRGGRDLLFDSLIFKEEYRKDAIQWLKRDMNFFKHADSDPDGTTEFVPRLTELFIMMSLCGIEGFGLKPDAAEAAFSHWYMIQHPEVLTPKGLLQRTQLSQSGALGQIERLPAREFFQYYMAASTRLQHVK